MWLLELLCQTYVLFLQQLMDWSSYKTFNASRTRFHALSSKIKFSFIVILDFTAEHWLGIEIIHNFHLNLSENIQLLNISSP